MKKLLLLSVVLLSGCATPRLTEPSVAVVTVLPFQPGDTGFYFDDANKAYLISKGVPASFFISTSRGWYMTKLQEQEAAELLAGKRNPGVWK